MSCFVEAFACVACLFVPRCATVDDKLCIVGLV